MKEKLSILIIDDDDYEIQILSELLDDLTDEWTVEFKSSFWNEGLLDTIVKKCFDVVFVDYYQAGTTGDTIIKKIKQQYKKGKVILITSCGSEDVAVKALRAGADDYFNRSELSKLSIKDCFNRLSLNRPTRNIKKSHDQINVVLIDDEEEESYTFSEELSYVQEKFKRIKINYNWFAQVDERTENYLLETQPDIIFMDYRLSDNKFGTDEVERLVTLGCNTSYYLITAFGGEDVVKKSIRCGVSDYFKRGEYTVYDLYDIIKDNLADNRLS